MSLTEADLRLIGGSDVAAIVGVDPYKTSLDVFLRIVEGRQQEDTKPLRRGRLMEPVIREMAREEYGLTLLGPRSLRRDFWRVTLDDVARDGDGEEIQEFKSVSPWAAGDYEEGVDALPQQHLCQVQFYMLKTGIPRARITALIGVDDLRSYRVTADAELQGMLVEAVERFHVDHILAKTPPALDGSEAWSTYLGQRYPRDTGATVAATPEAERWVTEYRMACADAEVAGERRDEAKNRLKEFLGEAKRLQGDGWHITWGRVRGREKTDWQAVCAAAGVPDALVKQHTARGAGHRQFRPSWAKEQDNG